MSSRDIGRFEDLRDDLTPHVTLALMKMKTFAEDPLIEAGATQMGRLGLAAPRMATGDRALELATESEMTKVRDQGEESLVEGQEGA
jgi:hypothetical protein